MINEDIIYENIKTLGSIIEKLKKEHHIKDELKFSKDVEPKVLLYGLRCAENALYNVLNEHHKFVDPKTDICP